MKSFKDPLESHETPWRIPQISWAGQKIPQNPMKTFKDPSNLLNRSKDPSESYEILQGSPRIPRNPLKNPSNLLSRAKDASEPARIPWDPWRIPQTSWSGQKIPQELEHLLKKSCSSRRVVFAGGRCSTIETIFNLFFVSSLTFVIALVTVLPFVTGDLTPIKPLDPSASSRPSILILFH